MRFRTEIEPMRAKWRIEHDTPVVMLGSCFTDEIGSRLEADGFDVLHNPFGPLYNPVSLSQCLRRAIEGKAYTAADLTEGPRGLHCLDYASRYSGTDADALLADINATQARLAGALERKPLTIITLGSAYVFDHVATGGTVGNCHKFPAADFRRRRLSVAEASAAIRACIDTLDSAGISRILFTVSPIRHLADGLHGNTIGKSILQVAVAETVEAYPDIADYFPAYEILLDDLRDYRFYAADMKHPSETAVDYIYEIFSDTFFSRACTEAAAEARRRFKASHHRQIL